MSGVCNHRCCAPSKYSEKSIVVTAVCVCVWVRVCLSYQEQSAAPNTSAEAENKAKIDLPAAPTQVSSCVVVNV